MTSEMNKKEGSILLLCTATCLLILSASKNLKRNVEVHKNAQRGDIMMGIYMTEHKGYAEFTSSVLKYYLEFDDVDIHLYNSFNRQYDVTRLQQFYGYDVTIKQLQLSDLDATKVYNENVFSLGQIFEIFMQTDHAVLFLIDSEMLVHPKWRTLIRKHMIDGDKAFLSLYHSATMHSYDKDCRQHFDDLCRGNIPLKFGFAITKKMANTLLYRHANLLNEAEWSDILTSEQVDALYPRKSLIMRIGQTDQDSRNCGESEDPYGFSLCDFSEWVRDGVEFYNDRCTSPSETFNPGESIELANREHRPYNRPAISYSLYGNKTRYTGGALANSKRIFSIYPGWKMWVYLDNSVPKDIVDELCAENVKLINLQGTEITNKMSWRFLIASEPVSVYAVRDIDSRLIKRGKTAVDEWISSGRKFHVMRDHKAHSRFVINGGMWGGLGGTIPDIKERIIEYRANDDYFSDMNFLRDVIWESAKQSVWVHDSHSLHTFGEDHPFAEEWSIKEFVGKVDFH